jgi:pimeloyl-ACP methyl ester carboxylesterase
MQYALRHPDRVSQTILMNTAPASHADYLLLRQERLERRAANEEVLNALESSPGYRDGDSETVAKYYEIDFGTSFKQPQLIKRLNLRRTKEDVLRGRAIEDRLMEGLYWSEGITIIPRLRQLRTPTLIIHETMTLFQRYARLISLRQYLGPALSSWRILGISPTLTLRTKSTRRSTSSSPAPDSFRGQEQQALPCGRTAAPVMIGKKYKLYSTA